jgi:hypothetical protein
VEPLGEKRRSNFINRLVLYSTKDCARHYRACQEQEVLPIPEDLRDQLERKRRERTALSGPKQLTLRWCLMFNALCALHHEFPLSLQPALKWGLTPILQMRKPEFREKLPLNQHCSPDLQTEAVKSTCGNSSQREGGQAAGYGKSSLPFAAGFHSFLP